MGEGQWLLLVDLLPSVHAAKYYKRGFKIV